MVNRGGRPLAIVGALLLAAAAVNFSLRIARERGLLPEPGEYWPRDVTITILLGALVALGLFVVFRGLTLGLARRGIAATALRPLETIVAAFVAAIVVIAVFADRTTALASLGLVGFGLTLALQRPILSIAGWTVLRFGRLFREGDRIEVNGIVGDVLEITVFHTRIWEIGSTSSPLPWGGSVSPLRPTGRIVSISNATFLEQAVANASAEVPWVFDEFAVSVAYEGDRRLAEQLLRDVATRVIDRSAHAEAARRYAELTRHLPIDVEFPDAPVIIASLEVSWIELRLRYLVDVRRRSIVRTALALAWQEATEAHADALPNVYPRAQPMAVGADGRPKP